MDIILTPKPVKGKGRDFIGKSDTMECMDSFAEFDSLDAGLRDKLALCQQKLRELGSVVVAFSAGVDSTLLLALAGRTLSPQNVLAAMDISEIHPQRDSHAASRIAELIGVQLVKFDAEQLNDANFTANSPDRCFHCKSRILQALKALAQQCKLNAVVCGNNADDTDDFRPGMKACEKFAVSNPLMDAALTKAEIRLASKALQLETWNKPSSGCLATRIPYDKTITIEKLRRIEQAEEILRGLGFAQCRLRYYDATARIEIPIEQMDQAIEYREKIVESIKKLGFTYITLDLEGFRSGSMNEQIGNRQ